MKKVLVFFLVFSINPLLLAGNNDEFRATWVITWHHINSAWTAEQNKAQVRRILDNHKKAHMDAVLWQCRQSGTAYYDSDYEPWGYYAGYNYPGYDPLAYAIEEAHKRGLELHAWFNVFQTSSTHSGTPAAEHPEWICRDRDGNPMTANRCVSPGLDSVREYTINVAMEIVRNYDIDGLHLDYVRWNEYSNDKQSQEFAKLVEEERLLDGMITDEQIQNLAENKAGRYLYDTLHPYSAGVPEGFDSWEDWWRWSVTEFVQVLHDSIQAVKPWVRLSPAALGKYKAGGDTGWNGYYVVFQDAALWFNEGYVEQLTPMHYHWTTASGFYDELKSDWEPYIQAGIDTGRLYTVGPGSYQFASHDVWDNHPAVINTCRTVPWVDGFQFFSYGSWRDYDYWDEAGETFFNRKTKVRATRLIDSIPPDPPIISLTEIDSLTYEITITPPVTVTSDHWYAIYRSTDSIDVDSDEIIDIHFGDTSFIYTDSFNGTQDFNGTYFYAATALDRYWNESDVSNLMQSDSIPSFAPTIVATTPAEGDTVSVDNPIIIYFSKTIDITSFDDTTITIAPEIGIFQLVWSDDNKTLTLEMSEYLEYDTYYTLTVAPSARDINGRPLDGDGDGIGGDTFTLNFKTKAQDDVPPEVVFTYPITGTDSFDVKDVITFVFDELIESNTLDTNSVALHKSSIKIHIQFLHSAIDNKSVINIQPEQPLETNTEYTPLLWNTITDTAGNPMESYFTVNFRTLPEGYTETVTMEDFTYPGDWKQPSYSGSTQGIVVPNTEWGYTSTVYLPAISPRKSAYLRYEWDITASEWLLREYLAEGPPRAVIFDTTYILQCYIYSDGSYNKFRFCLDDHAPIDSAHFHEVSKWITLDWYGWRLVEWKLNDPNSVGEWIGNGVLNPLLRFDSFQLTHEIGDSVKGEIYFDELRLVRKSIIGVQEMPVTSILFQNYPNPFNLKTTISFALPKEGFVELKVYDVAGREVAALFSKQMGIGQHEVPFDASGFASGIYYYRMTFNGQATTKKMLLVK